MVAVLLQITMTLGVGVESQMLADGEFNLPVPWQTWAARPLDCLDDNHWATIWSPSVGDIVPESCADNPLTIGNECHSSGQCNKSPDIIAQSIYEHRTHPGGLWCCNDVHWDRGLLYFLEVVANYWILYGEPPPLTGIALHVYDNPFYGPEALTVADMLRWRLLADLFGWHIAVTETACLRDTAAEVAGCMEAHLALVQETLQPDVMLWFILRGRPPQSFVVTDLQDADGGWTVGGETWRTLAGLTPARMIEASWKVYAVPVVTP